jgi:hypothetical protein
MTLQSVPVARDAALTEKAVVRAKPNETQKGITLLLRQEECSSLRPVGIDLPTLWKMVKDFNHIHVALDAVDESEDHKDLFEALEETTRCWDIYLHS